MLQMQKVEYALITTEKSLEGMDYVCYGIRMSYAGAQVSVEDLSLCKEEVEELIERCNRLELSPMHFQDVLEDFMAR